MSDSKQIKILSKLSRIWAPAALVFPTGSKVPNQSIILPTPNAHLVRQPMDCYGRKADLILYMLSNRNLKLGKNLRISATKSVKTDD